MLQSLRLATMALFKTRPDVRLLLPRPLIAGELASFVVELQCPAPIPVDAVSLSLYGDMVWFQASQYGRHRYHSRFLGHHVPLLASGTELDAGVHRLETQVRLSDELLPSWTGDLLGVQYTVEVHVDIPWWPDKRVTFVVRVADAGRPRPEGGPVVYANHVGGPPVTGPYIELSLGQRSVCSGGQLRLSTALGNVERNQYRKLRVELLAQESYPTGLGGHYVHEHPVARWNVALDAHAGELRPIPFSVQLPQGMVPSFELHGCRLSWILQVTADVAWGVDPKLRLPLVVQPDEVPIEGEHAAPLAVGSDRLRLIWSKVAREQGLEFDEDRIQGRRNGVQIEVSRTYVDGVAHVHGVLEYPDLGLGVRARRERRAMLGPLVTSIEARDAEQTAVVDELLGTPVRAGKAELLDIDDHRISFGIAGAGLEYEPLAAFVAWLGSLTQTLAELPDRVPPPRALRDHADAWTRAATQLSATLRKSDLCLSFERDGLGLGIANLLDEDGQLRATQLELDPKLTIPTRQQLLWTGDTPLPDHVLELDDLVIPPTWCAGSSTSASTGARIALQIDAHRVRVLLPAPLPDPLLERERIEALVQCGRQLRGEQGPYR